MNLIYAVMLAIIVEGIISYVKEIINKNLCWEYIASITLGVALALIYRIDLITLALGIEGQIPYVGMVLTGILLSRGSNYVWDIWQRLLAVKNPQIDK